MPHTERQLTPRYLLIASVLFVLACDTGPRAGPPASLEVVSGDDQQGFGRVELPQPVVLQVLDGDGRPVQNATVSFTVSAGDGTVTPRVVTTNGNGAAAALWTLGTAGIPQSLTAAVSGVALSHTFHATANAGALSAFAQVTAVPQSIISGAPMSLLQMQLVDSFGNAVHQAGVQITASLDGRNIVGQSLSGTKTISTDTTGIASFSDLVIRGLPTAWGGDRALLKFSAASLQSVTDTFTVVYGPPAILVVNPSSSVTVYAGGALAVDAAVLDAWRNLLPNMHVDYTYPTDDGSLKTVEMSDPGVIASIRGFLPVPTKPGTYSVTATSPEVPNQEITFSMTVIPSASALLIVSGDSVSAPSGSVVTLVVRAEDPSGNGVAGAIVHWSVESGAGYLGEGSTITTGSDATGQSSVTLALSSPGPVKVRATLGGTTVSIVFTVTAT